MQFTTDDLAKIADLALDQMGRVAMAGASQPGAEWTDEQRAEHKRLHDLSIKARLMRNERLALIRDADRRATYLLGHAAYTSAVIVAIITSEYPALTNEAEAIVAEAAESRAASRA